MFEREQERKQNITVAVQSGPWLDQIIIPSNYPQICDDFCDGNVSVSVVFSDGCTNTSAAFIGLANIYYRGTLDVKNKRDGCLAYAIHIEAERNHPKSSANVWDSLKMSCLDGGFIGMRPMLSGPARFLPLVMDGSRVEDFLHPPVLPFASRHKRIVAFFSNCVQGTRTRVLKELAALKMVDSFGPCHRTIETPIEQMFPNCTEKGDFGFRNWQKECVLNHYLFAIAMDSTDEDFYMTEKPWQVLRHSVIPIILGGNMEERYIPQTAMLRFSDFGSDTNRLLAEVNRIGASEKIFNQFLSWKRPGTPENEMMTRSIRKNFYYLPCRVACINVTNSRF